jgi:hypothetical protein
LQQEVRSHTQGFEFPISKFTVEKREMFYKSRLCYDWGKGAETDKDKCKDTDITNHPDEVKPLRRDEVKGDVHVTVSSNEEEAVQLPVIPTQHTGLAKQLKRKLARVKRYESVTRGVLEYSISGVELEVMFHKSVVNFCGKNETSDLEEYLPVGSEVYFEGEVVGEDRLLGCSDIIVTSVQEAKMQRKQNTSKGTYPLDFELIFSSTHEGLFQGRVYEGVISEIRPPFAFVAEVSEGGKTYEVFVLNRFFSPVEYGTRLPEKHPVTPYVAEGDKVHVIVNRRKEVNSKHTLEWFAVDAWTEEEDNAVPGTKPEVGFTHTGMDTEHLHEHLEGVIMIVEPEWGLLQVDHPRDEVMFLGKDTFLFGVRLAMLDLRQVLPIGESHSVNTNFSWIKALSGLV